MGSTWSKQKLQKVETLCGFPLSLAFLKRAMYALPPELLNAVPLAQNFDVQWRFTMTGWQGEAARHWAWYFRTDITLAKLLALDRVDILDKVVLSEAQHGILRTLNVPCSHEGIRNVDIYTWST